MSRRVGPGTRGAAASTRRTRCHARLLRLVREQPGLTVRQLADALKRLPHRVATDTADLVAAGVLRTERAEDGLVYFYEGAA